MTQLFSTIAASHAATQDSVRHELVRRPVDFDLGIMLSFAMLYLALVANTVAGRVRAEIPADERGRYRGASLAASVMVALGGVGLGELWVLRAEALRLGDEHLSGRTARIPWTQHRIALFLAFMLAYWGIAAIRNSRSSPRRASLYSS